jgi:hypothetical protein
MLKGNESGQRWFASSRAERDDSVNRLIKTEDERRSGRPAIEDRQPVVPEDTGSSTERP